MTSIFEGQPPKTRPFPIKTRVIWVPGIDSCLAGVNKLPLPLGNSKKTLTIWAVYN